MTNHLPQVIAKYITPSPPGYEVEATENEKAVVILGGKVVDRFSGGTRQVRPPARVVLASLGTFRWSPDTVSVSFRLADRGSNVEELLGVNTQHGDRITVSDVADSADLAALVRNSVARRASERELSADVGRALDRYGLSVESVRRGDDPPPPPPPHDTSLHDAARRGETETVLRLIIAGADINAKDESDNTPLRCAIINRKTKTAIALIAAGADIYIRYKGNTPLHTAEWCNEIKIVLALIAADKNVVDVQNWWEDTPLHSAVINDHIEVVRVLRDAGSNLNIRNKRGRTPLCEAKKRGRTEIEQALREGVAPPPKMSLHDAAYRGETEVALRLIIADVDVNHTNKSNNAPLRGAIMNRKTETALALIAARADVNANGTGGNKPLHTAEWKGEIKVVLALIAAGADIHARNNAGNTALHTAGIDGETEIAIVLIASGADIRARNYEDDTPVKSAKTNRHFKTAAEMERVAAAST